MIESSIEVDVMEVPRHYVVKMFAALAPADMIDVLHVLAGLDVAEGACGGFFEQLEAAAREAYTADLPPALTLPVPVPGGPDEGDDDDEDDDEPGGVAALKKA